MEKFKVTMNKYSFVLSSCDNYSDLWNPFFHQLKKYWKGFDYDVYLCTESKKYQMEGLRVHCPLNVPRSNTWSENLIELLEHIETEYVIFMLDDFWLKKPVDTEKLAEIMETFDKDKNIGFLCLLHQPASVLPVSKEYPMLVEYPRKAKYRITTQVGLWRKDYFLKILRSHESAWQFEIYGNKRSGRYKENTYVISDKTNSIFDYDSGGVLYRGKYVKEYVEYFEKEEGIKLEKERIRKPKWEFKKEDRDIVRRIKKYFTLKFYIDYYKSIIKK